MIAENIEKITEELARLEQFGSDIIGTVIVNRNGILVTSNLPLDLDDRKFGAMAATLYNGIETAVESFTNPEIKNITVEFENYQIVILGINERLIVASLLHLDINLGLILIELEEFILKIREE
ncbi:MAG: roadblock/LC7 domain-containing protein [Candidatus Lokiarchaeota archaeon]|nr:roadblock/LC7 domain-containing protein [Candidatus Lokiarchaeota archaeon]